MFRVVSRNLITVLLPVDSVFKLVAPSLLAGTTGRHVSKVVAAVYDNKKRQRTTRQAANETTIGQTLTAKRLHTKCRSYTAAQQRQHQAIPSTGSNKNSAARCRHWCGTHGWLGCVPEPPRDAQGRQNVSYTHESQQATATSSIFKPPCSPFLCPSLHSRIPHHFKANLGIFP